MTAITSDEERTSSNIDVARGGKYAALDANVENLGAHADASREKRISSMRRKDVSIANKNRNREELFWQQLRATGQLKTSKTSRSLILEGIVSSVNDLIGGVFDNSLQGPAEEYGIFTGLVDELWSLDMMLGDALQDFNQQVSTTIVGSVNSQIEALVPEELQLGFVGKGNSAANRTIDFKNIQEMLPPIPKKVDVKELYVSFGSLNG